MSRDSRRRRRCRRGARATVFAGRNAIDPDASRARPSGTMNARELLIEPVPARKLPGPGLCFAPVSQPRNFSIFELRRSSASSTGRKRPNKSTSASSSTGRRSRPGSGPWPPTTTPSRTPPATTTRCARPRRSRACGRRSDFRLRDHVLTCTRPPSLTPSLEDLYISNSRVRRELRLNSITSLNLVKWGRVVRLRVSSTRAMPQAMPQGSF